MENKREFRTVSSGPGSSRFKSAAALLVVLLAFVPLRLGAQTFEVLYTFTGMEDGSYPSGGVVIKGNSLYGTTRFGGAGQSGTVFQVNTDGETVLYAFTGGEDGAFPSGRLILGSRGTFYGTTAEGGDLKCAGGCGTVFRIGPPNRRLWTQSVLYSFPWPGTDGEAPTGGVTLDSEGNVYGTTSGGGLGYGTVFKLDPAGAETVLHSFDSSDGAFPAAEVIFDAAGNLYGATPSGGSKNDGTLFKLDANGNFTTLHNFGGNPGDGKQPMGALVRDSSGRLYGTTVAGGTFGQGTIFVLNDKNQGSLLYSFSGGVDGGKPWAGLVRDGAGNLYGTTVVGGDLADCRRGKALGCGTIFKLSPPTTKGGDWTLTTLYRFTGGADGGFPVAGLTRDRAGNLYGTTAGCHNIGPSKCSAYSYGTVFKLSPQ